LITRRASASRWALPILALGALLASPATAPATAAPAVYAPRAYKKIVKLPLMPGIIAGHINSYVVQRGDTLAWIAANFGVHPTHVTKPSAKEFREGMHRGQTIYVDQRVIQPAFKADTNGIVLNLPEAEVYFVDHGNLIKSYPVAVSNADWKAPIGDTHVVDMEKNPTWYIPKRIQAEMKSRGIEPKEKVDPGPNNPLGVRWIGFADGSFGFHGTTVPTSIKHYASHGCVRFRKGDIIDLYSRVHVGMPVHVIYQPVTLAVDKKSVWLSVYPDYYGLGFDFKGAVKALAYEAGVSDRIKWDLVEKAFRDKDGTIMEVAKSLEPPHPNQPSAKPTTKPNASPTAKPNSRPTLSPTAHPSNASSTTPSGRPLVRPTASATVKPVVSPTVLPLESTPIPTPTERPYVAPTLSPTARPAPTPVPTETPPPTTPNNTTNGPTVHSK
jgi:lipoprotein-anchoring transpeptidase ErfK/SrfK